MDSVVSLHCRKGAAMSDITEYLREKRECIASYIPVYYSWPRFWHAFANKYPIKDTPTHLEWHQISKTSPGGRYCFYCFIEERAGEMLIGNDGVSFIGVSEEVI